MVASPGLNQMYSDSLHQESSVAEHTPLTGNKRTTWK